MKGAGTEHDPYLIATAEEFYVACSGHDQYIKLETDIEFCGENGMKYFTGTTLNNAHIDLNMHSLKKIRVGAGQHVFSSENKTSGRVGYISNGVITDIFAESSNTLFDGIKFDSVSIGINASRMQGYLMYDCLATGSAIHAVNKTTEYSWFSSGGNAIFRDCDIFLDGQAYSNEIFGNTFSYYNADDQLSGCRITGKIDIQVESTNNILVKRGMDRCVVAVDMTSCKNARKIGTSYYNYFNIVDKSKINENVDSNYCYWSTVGILDPESNNRNGFSVEVVE